MLLSKSYFLKYLKCPAWFWFDSHKPEILKMRELSDFDKMLIEQGAEVESYVYQLFPGVVRVESKGLDAVEQTKELIAQGQKRIAQAAFDAGELYAQCDLVQIKLNGDVEIYEIKSSSSMQNAGLDDAPESPTKKEYVNDLGFQYHVLTEAGFIVDALYLIEVSKEYRKGVDLDLSSLLVIQNITDEVMEIYDELQVDIAQALNQLKSTTEPTDCSCKYKSRKNQCPAFPYLHPEWTDYAVYDMACIGNSIKRLRQLVDDGFVLIRDIPDEYDLLPAHRDQIHAWNHNEVISNPDEIRNELQHLEYPLFFLDYETTSTAIPRYEGTKPFEHIPFQYSLHIIDHPGATVRHEEYLHPDRSNPMFDLSQSLRSHMGDIGHVIVWNKSFEGKCNQNMAALVTDLSPFLKRLNHRLYDLKDIFSKRLYVHKEFKGSASIKKVLPVLVPELSYEGLAIAHGGSATTEWKKMVFELEDGPEKDQIKKDLLAYCKLDTLAMVKIYQAMKVI